MDKNKIEIIILSTIKELLSNMSINPKPIEPIQLYTIETFSRNRGKTYKQLQLCIEQLNKLSQENKQLHI
jgi:hypothetical protein